MDAQYPRRLIYGGREFRIKPGIELAGILESQIHPDDWPAFASATALKPEGFEMAADYILWGDDAEIDEERVRGHANMANSILDELEASGIELPPHILESIDKTREAVADVLAVLDEED